MGTYRLRILEKTDDAGVLTFVCQDDTQAVWTSSAPGTSGSAGSGGGEGPTALAFTRLHVLDIPLLRQADDYPGVYLAATGIGGRWVGCEVFQSVDSGSTWESMGTIERPATCGIAETKLHGWLGGNTVDTNSWVDVSLAYGTLSTVSFDSFLSGANPILIGDEVLRFRSATLLDAGRYRLTGFLRGQKGTERFVPYHEPGDRFVLLQRADLIRIAVDPSRYGSQTIYRGVTLGAALASAPNHSIYDGLVSSRPLAPIRLFSVVEADGTTYAAQWTRQTRYPAPWASNGDAPLGETSESYRVHAHDGLQEIQTTTQSATSITGIPKDLTILYPQLGVAQMSSVVGAGYEAETLLPSEDF